MVRAFAILALLVCSASLFAEGPRFRFVKGETLRYKLTQTTTVRETTVDEKSGKPVESSHTTRAEIVRQWKVTDFDTKGIATLEMSIVSMVWEQTLPNGEKDLFDSTKPDDLNKSEMAKHVGPVLAVLKIDPLGKVNSVVESKVGPAHRFAADLPFKLQLSPVPVKVGGSWDRQYTIQLDPPHGTGEKYESTQNYTVLEPKGGFLSLQVATTLKSPPESSSENIPLFPMMSEGTLYFHEESGRYYAARLKVERELKNHQGEGSLYKYSSTIVEDYQAK